MTWEYDIDYDTLNDPSDVYTHYAGGDNMHFSTAHAYDGNRSMRAPINYGTSHHGNTVVHLDESPIATNSYGKAEEIWSEFYLYIPDDFECQSDCRIWNTAISFGGGDSGGGDTDGTNGWSTRLQLYSRDHMPSDEYNLVEYVYNIDERAYDLYDNVTIKQGEWTHFVTHVKVNSWSGGTANYDGVSECWVNGKLAFSNDDWRWTTTEQHLIEANGAVVYFHTPEDNDLYYDAHKIHGGSTDPREDGGEEVTDPDPDYDVIKVGAGETFSKSLSQGEVWENKIIDITADGAGYSIGNSGTNGNWTMRNIGIRGQWDHDPGSSAIVLDVEEEDEWGLVENVCMTDGAVNNDGQTDPGGFFVHGDHAGTLTFRNVNVQNFGDNGIYASGPGTDHSGNFGTVHFENCYAANNGTAGLRLGTDGSSATNCVAWNNTRGLWCLFQDIEATDCDFGANGHDIRVGSSSQEEGYTNGTLTVDNVRWDSEDVVRSGNEIYGSSAGSPNHRGPGDIGAPRSPVEAATGGGSTDPDPEPDPEPPDNFAPGVTTATPDVGFTNVVLHGELTDLDGQSALEVGFSFREAGGAGERTPRQYMDSTGTFEWSLSNLDPDTEYEFRAFAETTHGAGARTDWVSLTTDPVPDSINEDFGDADLGDWAGDTDAFTIGGGS